MEKGFLHASSDLFWDTTHHKVIPAGDELISSIGWGIPKVTRLRCPYCRLVLFRYWPMIVPGSTLICGGPPWGMDCGGRKVVSYANRWQVAVGRKTKRGLMAAGVGRGEYSYKGGGASDARGAKCAGTKATSRKPRA